MKIVIYNVKNNLYLEALRENGTTWTEDIGKAKLYPGFGLKRFVTAYVLRHEGMSIGSKKVVSAKVKVSLFERIGL